MPSVSAATSQRASQTLDAPGARRAYTDTLAGTTAGLRFWRTVAVLLAVAQLVQAVGWPLVYVSIPKKWFYHMGPGLVANGPAADACANVATNAVLPLLSTNSGSVRQDLASARTWMTDEAAGELERALADFERTYKVPYEDYVASEGVGTAFDELRTSVEDPVGTGATRRYPVLVEGLKTTLSKRHEPLGTSRFAVRVYLTRVAEDEANPLGLLMARFEPVAAKPGDTNDLPPILGERKEEPDK